MIKVHGFTLFFGGLIRVYEVGGLKILFQGEIPMSEVKTYKACKRTAFWFFVVAFGIHTAFKAVLKAISGYLPQNVLIIADMAEAALMIIAVTVLPIYILIAKYEVSGDSVKLRTGIVLILHQYVPTSSVLSVTTVMTPLSILTGFNFVVLNSPGAKTVMPFVIRKQAREISATVNGAIRQRTESRGEAQ